jgi:hypothetical protein
MYHTNLIQRLRIRSSGMLTPCSLADRHRRSRGKSTTIHHDTHGQRDITQFRLLHDGFQHHTATNVIIGHNGSPLQGQPVNAVYGHNYLRQSYEHINTLWANDVFLNSETGGTRSYQCA